MPIIIPYISATCFRASDAATTSLSSPQLYNPSVSKRTSFVCSGRFRTIFQANYSFKGSYQWWKVTMCTISRTFP
jgi:hypothetical protein